MSRLSNDPTWLGVVAVVPATVVGLAPLVDYHPAVLPLAAVAIWVFLILALSSKRPETKIQPEVEVTTEAGEEIESLKAEIALLQGRETPEQVEHLLALRQQSIVKYELKVASLEGQLKSSKSPNMTNHLFPRLEQLRWLRFVNSSTRQKKSFLVTVRKEKDPLTNFSFKGLP